MYELDKEAALLKNRQGVQTIREIVQFVKFQSKIKLSYSYLKPFVISFIWF